MKMHSLSWSGVRTAVLSHNKLALLGGALLGLASGLAAAQSVTFAGVQTTLPASGLGNPQGVAVDTAGDFFIADQGNNRVVELPRTGAGYGSQTTLPFSGLDYPAGVAVDAAGDVFVVDQPHNRVLELPWTGTGWGSQTTLPFKGLDTPVGVAVDNAGDVFEGDYGPVVRELPKTATGYGSQVILPFSGLSSTRGIAVDSAEDVFLADTFNARVVELPKTATGYGSQTTLPLSGLSGPWGVALDSAGDVLVADYSTDLVVKLLKTATGYGQQTTLPFSGLYRLFGDAVDSEREVFVSDGGHNRILELQTHSVNFGGANVCAPGSTTPAPCSQTLTLNFHVHDDTTLGTPHVLTGGAPNLDFTLASGSTCTGAVTAGSTCTANVTFAPLAAGFRNGSVQITDGSETVITTIQLSGFGVAATTGPPVAQVSTTYLQFGSISFGEIETLPLIIANIGGGTLTVAPSISGHSYTIANTSCAAGVTPGNTCNLVVAFSPSSIAVNHDDLLTLQTNGSANPTVKLHGVANGLSVLGGGSGESLKFGSVSSGSTEVLPLTVTNVGLPGTVGVGTAITVRATRTPTSTYKILTTAQNTCLAGIAEGESCTLPVEFAPTTSGTHDDLLTLTPSAGGGSTTVWLVGTTP
jgi:hypothetical protein